MLWNAVWAICDPGCMRYATHMNLPHNPVIVACYACSAFLTLVQIGILFWQRGQFTEIKNEFENEFEMLREEIANISIRVDALTKKHNSRNTA